MTASSDKLQHFRGAALADWIYYPIEYPKQAVQTFEEVARMWSHREVPKAVGITAAPKELADGYECSPCAQHFCTREELAVHSSKKQCAADCPRMCVRD